MMANLLQLASLGKLLPRRLESLTLDELKGVSEVLGVKIHVTDELREAALALLEGKSLDTVADMIQSPESIQQLVLFLKGGITHVAEAEIENHPDYAGVNSLTLSFSR